MDILSSLCSLPLLLIIFTSQVNAAIDPQNLFLYFCDHSNDRGNYTANSTYASNLNALLPILISDTEIDYGFYSFSYGQNTDKVNAIGLCRVDVKPNECRGCLHDARANLIQQYCPTQKEAIGWPEDEKCMLRYSDRSIFGLMEYSPFYYAKNGDNASDVDQFRQEVLNLLDNLTSRAAAGNSRLKYAADSAAGPNAQTIYGLVQCTPDLSQSDCNNCLVESLAQIRRDCCIDKKGGRVVRPSCNVRFETDFLFYEPTALVASPPPPFTSVNRNTSSKGKSNNTAISIAIAVLVVVAVVVLTFICIYLRVRKPRKKFETQEEDAGNEIEIFESFPFNFNTIRNATNDFSDSNKLGQGGFGAVYRGKLSNGQEIAVKRLSSGSTQGDLEFKNEVLLVSKLQHRNLVRLLGFCLEGSERLLVYEFVPNKSLDYFLFDQTKRVKLDWEKRYKIIASIARGILYLHEDSRLRIIHRDLKASNILLDEGMNPKISDFGTARLFAVNQTQENTNRIVGTYGYMAPEYVMHGQFSMKSDVFSFGVLVLEIVSGHKSSGIRHGENIEYLLSFAWKNWRDGSTTNIIDPILNNDSLNEIMRSIHIGLLCVQENVSSRPTMASVVLMLNSHDVTLPIPTEPAFYVDSRNENNSAQESINEASITEPYPR